MAKAKQTSAKIKKKRWFKVFAPSIFGEALLGESYVVDQQTLLDKCMTVNLMSITGDMKKQNTNISFKITGIRPEGASTEVIAYELVPASIKRMVKRGNKAIHESFLVKTKDNVTVRLKPIIFTRSKSKGSISTMIRKIIRSSLTKKVSALGYYSLVNELVSHKIQRALKDDLNKIYPIRTSEIRAMKKIDGEALKEAEKEDKPAEEEQKKPEEDMDQKARETKESDTKKAKSG